MEDRFERRGGREFGGREDFGGRGSGFGGDRSQRKSFGPIPVKEGDTYDVEIEGIGDKGDGIAKVQGYVIVVPNVKKGDHVKVRVNAVRGKVSFGEVVGEVESKLLEPKGDGEDTEDTKVEEPSDEAGGYAGEDADSDMGDDNMDDNEEEK